MCVCVCAWLVGCRLKFQCKLHPDFENRQNSTWTAGPRDTDRHKQGDRSGEAVLRWRTVATIRHSHDGNMGGWQGSWRSSPNSFSHTTAAVILRRPARWPQSCIPMARNHRLCLFSYFPSAAGRDMRPCVHGRHACTRTRGLSLSLALSLSL